VKPLNKFKIYAHRGYSGKYPENTILAFQKAFEAGAGGVECDIQKTGDGRYVIIHDDVLDRVSRNKTGFVNEMTLSEIKDCDLGSGQTVPELSEFLMSIPHNGVVNIELKSETLTYADCPEILGMLLNHLRKEDILVSSFEPSFLP
jgi:glycerophosphoryl diester phosphodiesterase